VTFCILISALTFSTLAQELLDDSFLGVQRERTPLFNKYIHLFERWEAGNIGNDSDAFKSFSFLANKYGYRFEEHKVETEDGYILSLYRIPGLLNHSLEEAFTQPK